MPEIKQATLRKVFKIGGLAFFFCLAALNAYCLNSPPAVVSLAPSIGVSRPNQTVTFTTTFSDANGWQNIQYVYFLVNTSLSGYRCFYGYYNQNTNKLYLRNDANSAWLGGYAPGSSYSIENSYAKINCSQTTITGSGTTLSVKWSVTFKSAFSGAALKKTYLYVRDDSGAYKGWLQKGTWYVDNPPSAGTITPSQGQTLPDQEVLFTATYSDPDGYKNLYVTYLLINTSVSSAKCFSAYYNQNTNKLYLYNDAGTAVLGGYAPRSSYTIENSYVKLNCAKTTVVGSGTTLTVTWAITFKSTFTGIKNTYLYARDDAGLYTGWVKKGIFQITTLDAIAPTGTITINNGAGYSNTSSVTLALTAQDNAGGSGMDKMSLSNDNLTFSSPEPYAVTKSWTLSSGDGTKTVYVKFSDKAGNWSQSYSDTIILDTTKPSTPAVIDDGATTDSATQLHASFSSSDTVSGIAEYQYRISRDSTAGVTIVDWTSTGTTPSVTKTGLSLISDKTYYFGVKAKNAAGLWSDIGYSDGIKAVLPDATPPQITNLTPVDGSQFYENENIRIEPTVSDTDPSPLEYQFSIDGVLQQAWFAQSSYNWTATAAGSHTLKVEVRDAGGQATKEAGIYILRKPVSPP